MLRVVMPRWVGCVLLGAFLALQPGCGQDTPMGSDFASPAERDASPGPDDGSLPTRPPSPAERRAPDLRDDG